MEIQTPVIDSIRLGHDMLEVTWANGREDQYAYLWLRDNCASCFHPSTQERVFDLLSVSQHLHATKYEQDNRDLIIFWSEGHKSSRFSLQWLYENGFQPEKADISAFKYKSWKAEFESDIGRVNWDDYINNDQSLLHWLDRLSTDGLALLDNMPTENETIVQMADRISYMRRSNFGKIFNVQSVPNPINQAYTSDALPLHTDLPNHETPPGFQFLHCLRNDAEGGYSTFADSFSMVETLRERDPEAFDILCNTPIPFRFHDDDYDLVVYHPVIRTDAQGNIFEVKYNAHLASTFQMPADQMVRYYKAYRSFMALTRRPEYIITVKLQPGQMVAFDNRRIMHGRTAFDPNTGARHLRGCYIDRGELLSRKAVLQRPC